MAKVLYIDVETTGTDPSKHGLVQIAGEVRINGELAEEFNWHVQPFPEDEIEDAALEVNGITREDIATFTTPDKVYGWLIGVLARYVDRYDRKDKLFLVAYNATFDERFFRRFFEKNEDNYFGSWFWFPPLCVMSLAAHIVGPKRPELKNFKLETVAEHFGLTREGEAHDAASDIALTRELYEKLRKALT